MIGHGFMGAAHSQGWRVAPRFFDLPLEPEMTVVVGRNAATVEASARKWGWAESATDWREVIARDDIDVVDVVTPGNTHAEIAIAALEAGKHVLCEKPLANSVAEAEAMAAAATAAAARGIRSMVGFTYRRVPATTFARDLVAAGRIGEIRQVRAEYLQDWLMDPEGPMTWRLDKDLAGSGALGDIGAHAIDLTEYITGQRVTSVSGILETLVSERPLLGEGIGLSGTASAERGTVTVDDVALFTGRLESGALASFEATRFRTGRKNALRIEISGSKGAIAFDLERLNELEFYDATLPETGLGFQRILVTEHDHPYLAPWWPTGHMLGYEHGFSHQVYDFVTAIDEGTQPRPSFDDGLHVQRVLDAVERSSAAGSAWVRADD
ncbi:Gfo/Idh/MocA family oxidoreductase [Microbacterium sp. CFH 31415]|uniref:Gfo/Idh/MocA family protein n=1 Tax=Microbacterium sp. CFH 31415 TaxID=2921732 RepID=UPI001F1387F0|nr:Gfo/Idh/MocA family oxidoreductase [Microbacterium sp. CFH 31415]MCH6230968.1 Gfo/Idh/MocA family oxidoreductase [Microbacterium sp. CFH 31415]